ncbi:MAG: DJ-1/PfpI family protein [Cyclobacteriaceae bacterium]
MAGCATVPQSSEDTTIQNLPTIGILIFDDFLLNEVSAPMDIFSKPDIEGTQLFQVVTIAKEKRSYRSEEGLTIIPDYDLSTAPALKVLVVPSSYHPEKQLADQSLINFITQTSPTTDFVASHCAGAFLLGKSGIADSAKIVTYRNGGSQLQAQFPSLKVQDDQEVAFINDGKIFSSNGNLISYPASLALLEKLSSAAHRKHIEQSIYLDRLVETYHSNN